MVRSEQIRIGSSPQGYFWLNSPEDVREARDYEKTKFAAHYSRIVALDRIKKDMTMERVL
jgi:hypothetical protein